MMRPADLEDTPKRCPNCERVGRAVSDATLLRHVIPRRLESLRFPRGWHYCAMAECRIVYFRPDRAESPVVVDATKTAPFHKGDDPQRLICFCFGHRVIDVELDAHTPKGARIKDAIEAECRNGASTCEKSNPSGRCCLGDVAAIMAEAGADVSRFGPDEDA